MLLILISIVLMCTFLFAYFNPFYPLFKRSQRKKGDDVKTLIVIGSGGHTAEMLFLVRHLPSHYRPRTYFMAQNDKTSETKIRKLESSKATSLDDFTVVKIPRSRNVHQSYITSVITTLHSVIRSVVPVLQSSPDLVLCNGPGTCIPICIIVYLFKKVLFWETKIIFVESFCRVTSLSLSGKIMMYIADHVVVQWPELALKYPSTVYLGKLL